MSKRVAIIGAGPSGLAQLRAFSQPNKKAKQFQKSFAMKSRTTGVVYGTTLGVQA